MAKTLLVLAVELLIHTAGPFQDHGYGVARAAAADGAHYIDWADGRRFLCDFTPALNATFQAARLIAISGASTIPALVQRDGSAAVQRLVAHRPY